MKSVDLSLMNKFDASTGTCQIKIASYGVCLLGKTLEKAQNVTVWLHKNGSIIVLKDDDAGCKVTAIGNGGKARCIRNTSLAREFIRLKIAAQTIDVEWSDELMGYIGDVVVPKQKVDFTKHPYSVQRGDQA